LDHVGIVVDDLDQAKRFCSDVLGLELKSEHHSPATSATAVFFGFGSVDLELLEIADPQMRRQRMAGERQARIEHLGVAVDDLDRAIAQLRSQGVRTSTAEPYAGAGWRYYFTDPDTTDGVVYQFFQTD
jgi:methylmalonyl-CoA/ethylmalonyl-CoA epimerase